MPVAPGRNLAMLVEVAARNQLLRIARPARRAAAGRAARAAARAAGRSRRRRPGGGGPVKRRRRPRRATLGRAAARFVVVTGLSGAGKSHAIRALEDLGYFCVDNLPVALIPTFADLALVGQRRRSGARRSSSTCARASALARFPARLPAAEARSTARRVRLVFLEAERRGAPAPLQRDAAAASARRRRGRSPRASRGAPAAAADPPAGRSGRRHEPADRARAAARAFSSRPAAPARPRRSSSTS